MFGLEEIEKESGIPTREPTDCDALQYGLYGASFVLRDSASNKNNIFCSQNDMSFDSID